MNLSLVPRAPSRLLIPLGIPLLLAGCAGTPVEHLPESAINTGDTAWMLISAALVMLMTPALALFYGGLVRSKNVLSVVMQSFIALGVVTMLWVLVGYSLAFAPSAIQFN